MDDTALEQNYGLLTWTTLNNTHVSFRPFGDIETGLKICLVSNVKRRYVVVMFRKCFKIGITTNGTIDFRRANRRTINIESVSKSAWYH